MRTFLLGPQEEDEDDEASNSGEEPYSDEEEITKLKRRSIMSIERNLMEDCDSSILQPQSISLGETGPQSSAQTVERVLMERMLLRKELRLRSMQERLLAQEKKLEEMEARLREVEALPGFRGFQWLCMVLGGSMVGIGGVKSIGRGLLQVLNLVFYHFPVCLLQLLPPSFTILLANFAHQLGSLVVQRAENISNQCIENLEWQNEKNSGVLRRRKRRR